MNGLESYQFHIKNYSFFTINTNSKKHTSNHTALADKLFGSSRSRRNTFSSFRKFGIARTKHGNPAGPYRQHAWDKHIRILHFL